MDTEASKVYKVFVDSQTDTVVMDWKGYATSQQFRDGTELMLNYLIESKVHKVLADAKDMILIGMEDQQWMETSFLPRATRFGLKTCAIVKPESYFNKVAIESITRKIDPEKIQVSVFDNVEEARAWLQQANGD